MKLCEIAHVHAGYTYRGSLKNRTVGNTALIQMKDVSQAGIERVEQFARVRLGRLSAHYWLGPGDLIFRSRGHTNTAVLVTHALPRTTCIAPLILIRVKPHSQVLPAYLLWLINHPHTQQQIARFARFSRNETLRMITVATMQELDLVIPSLADQHKIVAAVALQQQLQTVAAKLAENQRTYCEQVLLQFAQYSASRVPA